MVQQHIRRDRPAWRTCTYTDIDDPNAIKTSIATVAAETTYTGADLNGVMANPGPAYTKMHQLTVTTAVNAGSYNLAQISITGTDQYGNTRVVYATLTDTDGGETLSFKDSDGNDVGCMTAVSILIPAMVNTGGAFEFGVADVIFDDPAINIRGGSANDIAVEYEDGVGDTLACQIGEQHKVYVKKILDTGTTAFPITAYL